MSTNAFRVKTAPDFYAPFRIAQAYRVNGLVYISGQASIDEEGTVVGAGDLDAQIEQTMKNLASILEAAGSDLSKIIKVTIFLRDIAQFPKIITMRENYFTPPYPADTVVEVSSLALPELEIEIEAIALVDGEIID